MGPGRFHAEGAGLSARHHKRYRISDGTFQRVSDALNGWFSLPTWLVVVAVEAFLIMVLFWLAPSVTPLRWSVPAGALVLVASCVGAYAVGRAAGPRRDAYKDMIPQVVDELYPDFAFDDSADVVEIRGRLPQRVLRLVDGIDEYAGTLCRRTPQGDIRVYAVAATDPAHAGSPRRHHLIYELRLPLGIPVAHNGYVQVSDKRLVPAAPRPAARIAVTTGPMGDIPGTTLVYHADRPDRALDTLTRPVIAAIQRYFDVCRAQVPPLPAGVVVIADRMVYIVVRDATLAFEGASERVYTAQLFDENAEEMRVRLDAVLALLEEFRSASAERAPEGARERAAASAGGSGGSDAEGAHAAGEAQPDAA